jgi:hypothetical protein
MSDKRVFNCENCGKKVEISATKKQLPECCDQPMMEVPDLPACELSSTAEHSRFDDLGEPCDDGRRGKI